MTMPKKNKKKKAVKTLRKLIDIGIFLLIVLLITLVLNRYVIQRTKVHNVSMQGTLKEGDVLLTDMISYAFDEPKRFDIICFRNPGGGDDLIKRIIALPGESIRIAGGEIYIDGEKAALEGKKLVELRKKVGMVFQQFNLFEHKRIIDNVTLADRKSVV